LRLLLLSDTHCKSPAQIEHLLDVVRPYSRNVEIDRKSVV